MKCKYDELFNTRTVFQSDFRLLNKKDMYPFREDGICFGLFNYDVRDNRLFQFAVKLRK